MHRSLSLASTSSNINIQRCPVARFWTVSARFWHLFTGEGIRMTGRRCLSSASASGIQIEYTTPTFRWICTRAMQIPCSFLCLQSKPKYMFFSFVSSTYAYFPPSIRSSGKYLWSKVGQATASTVRNDGGLIKT